MPNERISYQSHFSLYSLLVVTVCISEQLESADEQQHSVRHNYTTRVGCWATQLVCTTRPNAPFLSFPFHYYYLWQETPGPPFFSDTQVPSASINTSRWARVRRCLASGYLATQTNCAPDCLCFTSATCQPHLLSERDRQRYGPEVLSLLSPQRREHTEPPLLPLLLLRRRWLLTVKQRLPSWGLRSPWRHRVAPLNVFTQGWPRTPFIVPCNIRSCSVSWE